jgi:hypothetical protein
MSDITFLQLRPSDAVNEVWASTRRKEGTLVVDVPEPSADDLRNAHKAGLVTSSATAGVDAPAYVILPSHAAALAKQKIAGWRVSIVDDGSRMDVLEALAVTRAAYLRTTRRSVAQAAELVAVPGGTAIVSVFVDDVPDAVSAIEDGARDLLLRDWDTERIGELREAVGERLLVERGAFPVDVTYDEAAAELEAGSFSAYLNQIDGSGRARPRTEWAPGKDMATPQTDYRVSFAWRDAAWLESNRAYGSDASAPIAPILGRALDGIAPTRDEVEVLFGAHGSDVEAIADVADTLRSRVVGDDVTFVVNRNINYTNQCYFKCGFCAFSKGPRSLDLRGEPYLMSIDEVVGRSVEAWESGATEVCLQGGIHPEFTGQFYVDLVTAIKAVLPASERCREPQRRSSMMTCG